MTPYRLALGLAATAAAAAGIALLPAVGTGTAPVSPVTGDVAHQVLDRSGGARYVAPLHRGESTTGVLSPELAPAGAPRAVFRPA
ncbi:hypothetical protein [Kineococcus auxinigenes]|uniref:hypothetical protein n=1 Tax=unclassified Kineococcus TaxID=2621656 RepID=UPI003D7D4980